MPVDSLPDRSIDDAILLLRSASPKRRISKLVLLRGQNSLRLVSMLGQDETVVRHAVVDTLVWCHVHRLDRCIVCSAVSQRSNLDLVSLRCT